MQRRSPALIGMLFISGTAFAHAHLQKSTPADGSNTAISPTEIVLQFSQPARLTMLTIQKEAGEVQKLRAPETTAARVNVPLPRLAAGQYTVKLRFAAADGHVMDSVLRFSVGAEYGPSKPAPSTAHPTS